VYRLLKGVKISISTDRNVNNEFIPVMVKNETFWTPVTHAKVTFSLFLERISKKYESFEFVLPGVGYYL
jgi:hypothetical protein